MKFLYNAKFTVQFLYNTKFTVQSLNDVQFTEQSLYNAKFTAQFLYNAEFTEQFLCNAKFTEQFFYNAKFMKHSAIFDLHLVIIGLENQFLVFLRVATLHRFYCIFNFMGFIVLTPRSGLGAAGFFRNADATGASSSESEKS